jgi:hypothetical protein
VIFDGRNLYQPAVLAQAGLQYEAIGQRDPATRRIPA